MGKPWELDKEYRNVKANNLYVVDFYANWCQPCLQFKPKFTSLAMRWKQTKEAYYKSRGWTVHFIAFDCAIKQSSQQICHQNGVPHYPYVQMKTSGAMKFQLETADVDSMEDNIVKLLTRQGVSIQKDEL